MEVKFSQDDILKRGVEEIIEKKSLEKKLKSGKKLRVKFGIDPTGPDIHLGHTVPLWKLRQFQDLGHQIVLIIGDFTATIGDPSGRSAERKPLTEKDVKNNMKRYVEQVEKILDIKKTEIRYNSEWHKKEGLEAALQLARSASLQQLIKRSDFAERIKKGNDITFIELFYPLLQGYDSLKIKADVEIGGTDQKFNLLMGRQVQKRYGQEEQDIIMLPIVNGTDGKQKMSKSFDNYIALLDKPDEMFGKTMSVPDGMVKEYFELLTPVSQKELSAIKKEKVSGKNARDLKLKLAETLTAIYWGEDGAKKAKERFLTVFQKQETPKELDVMRVKGGESTTQAFYSLVGSKTELRRLIDQGAVYYDDNKVSDYNEPVPKKPSVLRIGKRIIKKIVPK